MSVILCQQITAQINPCWQRFSVTAYTDNKSLPDAVRSNKQTLEKWLMADISSLHEMVDQNEVQILWTEKDKLIRMFYQKQGHRRSFY